ncbi:hypothetical protein BCR42DRAFT_397815 [Absidia repens]|uniref:Uncharacterized protein n=1 Tax=Absidia repens TaxID=90262 RepID=A0A1X2I072_9FUNG|nr:hypothetical protein BCR42DRAFT_397815 [Absidia repens]
MSGRAHIIRSWLQLSFLFGELILLLKISFEHMVQIFRLDGDANLMLMEEEIELMAKQTALAYNFKRIILIIIVVVAVDIIGYSQNRCSVEIGVSYLVNKSLREESMVYSVGHTLSTRVVFQ